MGRSKPLLSLNMLWQVPLALLSLALFLVLRSAYRLLAPKAELQAPGEVTWRPLGPCSLSTAWERLRIQLSRPLWDAHAVIASTGPFPVQETLRIQVASATSSARTWQIYLRGPSGAVVQSLVSSDMAPGCYWHDVTLPAGVYQLETRYYGAGEEVELPRVEIDGSWAIPRQETSTTISDLYFQALVELEGTLSRALNYHVFVAMDRGAFLGWVMGLSDVHPAEGSAAPEHSIDHEKHTESRDPWLAGDGAGEFVVYRSGALSQGEALQVEVSPSAFRFYDVYLTLFSAGGRPTAWQRLQDASVMTQPRQGPTAYLIQLQRRGREAADLPESLVSVGHLKGMGRGPIRRVGRLA